jgi:hypothetical protein
MRPFHYIRYVLLSAVILGGGVKASQDGVAPQVATLDDGQQREGKLQRTAAGGFVFESGSASIPVRRVTRIEFPAPEVRGSTGRFRVWLWGGERLEVQEVRLDKQAAQLVLPDGTNVRLDGSALAAVSTGPSERRVSPGRRRLGTGQDQILLVEGDELFGDLVALDKSGCTFQGGFPSVRFGWDELQQVQFRRGRVQGRSVRGLIVRLHLGQTEQPADDELLEGALVEWDEETLVLDHPHLGRLGLPRNRLRSIEILGDGLRVDVESAEHHLGNDVRAELPLPFPDGTELVRTFTLERLPEGPAEVVCRVVQLESAQQGGRFARDLQEGHLRSDLWINDQLVDYMNRYVSRPIDEPQRLRIPVPAGTLKRGENTLRITQTPLPDDKSDFDDFLLAKLAIELPES